MSKSSKSHKAVAFEISGFAILCIFILYVVGYWAVSSAPGQGAFAFIVGVVGGASIAVAFWFLNKFTQIGKGFGWK